MANVRQAILNELKRRGKSRYWLVKKAKMRPATVYGFLSGGGASLRNAEKLMKVLDLEVQAKK